MSNPQQYQVNFYQESHCDACSDIVHFHFEDKCPVCHGKFAGTDQYCSVSECIEDGGIFSCQECETKFKIISFDACEEPEARIEVIKNQS